MYRVRDPHPTNIKSFLASLDKEHHARALEDIHSIFVKAKERDDDYLRRHQNQARSFVLEQVSFNEKATNDLSHELLKAIKSALYKIPQVGEGPDSRKEYIDGIEGWVMRKTAEYHESAKLTKRRLNSTMNKFDESMRAQYEYQRGRDDMKLLEAFIKLKDDKDDEKATRERHQSEVEDDSGLASDTVEDWTLEDHTSEEEAAEENALGEVD